MEPPKKKTNQTSYASAGPFPSGFWCMDHIDRTASDLIKFVWWRPLLIYEARSISLRSPRSDMLRGWLSLVEKEISVSQALVAKTVGMGTVKGGDGNSAPPEPSSPTPGSPAERLGCLEMLVTQME